MPERRTGSGWKWLAAALALLLVGVIAFIVWAASLAEDPTPLGPSAGPSAGPDAVTVACGPVADIPRAEAELLVACAPTPPIIDGRFDEWAGVTGVGIDAVIFPRSGANPHGVHGTARLLWNRDALYVQADVVDPVIIEVDESQPDQYWRGDSISFEIGPDARELGPGAGVRNGRDRHVIIGVAPGGAARGAINTAAGGDFPPGGAVPEIEAALARTPDGYLIEARVPWAVLGVDPPTRGAVLAGQVNISDARLDPWNHLAMISSNPDRIVQRRPGAWQPIILGDVS